MTIRENKSRKSNSSSGVALIIVLGVMAILLMLATIFFITMRTERLVSRNYADDVRARNLAKIAIVRAMEDVDDTMTNCCYPCWNQRNPTFVSDALSSQPSAVTNQYSDILSGEAYDMIPRAIWNDTVTAALNCYWSDIVSFDGTTNGRISYLVVNCSGLLDANLVGGTSRTCSTNVQELSLWHLPDLYTNEGELYSNRAEDVRYETVAEIAAMNNIPNSSLSNLFFYSYDPGRDQYPTNMNLLGTSSCPLANKFWINAGTNPSDPAFMTAYFSPLTNLLTLAGYSSNATQIAWNIVNYITPGRVPQDGGAQPWLDDTISKDVPLINEVVLAETDTNNLCYRFYVELWYPFVPNVITPANGFHLRIDVYTNIATPPTSCDNTISNMTFGDPNSQFLVFQTPDFQITVNGTNYPVSMANPVWFLSQVLSSNGPVDQAMDPSPFVFTTVTNYSVNDPRCNGHSNDWSALPTNTLGKMNTICDQWVNNGQGLPIHHVDAPMKSIGEIGYIFCGTPWQDIQLVDCQPINVQFALPDLLTVRQTNTSTHGLVNISTQQKDVLESLFYRMVIGYSNAFTNITVKIDGNQKNQLWGSVNGPFLNFRNLFNSVDTEQAYTNWHANGQTGGDLKEDAFRNILEMVTFRQNIFTVIVAAQVYAPMGTTVVAEKRAMAIVYRDAYTGKSFTRFFKWLSN